MKICKIMPQIPAIIAWLSGSLGGSIMLKVRIYDFALDELGGGNGGGNNGSSSAPGPSASAPGGGFGGSAEPASFDLTKEEGQDLILRGW
jgi:hypothetical protein